MVVRASSILEDFNWAATLVLRVHKIVGMAGGMEVGNGSIFSTQMEPNESKNFLQSRFLIYRILPEWCTKNIHKFQ